MNLEKSMIKGAMISRLKVNGRSGKVVEMKINDYYLYESEWPDYLNIYTIRIPAGVGGIYVSVAPPSPAGSVETNYALYVDWGRGNGLEKCSGNYATKVYSSGTYTIKTTGEIGLTMSSTNDGGQHNDYYTMPGAYVADFVSIRNDYISSMSLFRYCSSIKNIRKSVIDKLNNIKPTGLWDTFSYCKSLESLDLSNWDVSNVTSMSNMFYQCEKLTTLDLSNWHINNVTYMSYNMFYNCNNLHTLRLDNCDKTTINMIINSGLPTNIISETTKEIYCMRDNAAGLEDLLPEPWQFHYID